MDNMKNKTSKVNRWRLELSEYSYVIEYKPGIKNTNADALSRVNECGKEENKVPLGNQTINMVESLESNVKEATKMICSARGFAPGLEL